MYERAAMEDAASTALILDRLDYLDDNYDNDVSYLVNEDEDATVAARRHAAPARGGGRARRGGRTPHPHPPP